MTHLEYLDDLIIKEEANYGTPYFFDCARGTIDLYFCKNCSLEFDTLVQLKRHEFVKHMRVTPEDYSQNDYICRTCLFNTCSYLLWFKHLLRGCLKKKIHMNESAKRRKRNKQSADKNKWVQCDKCPYKTKLNGNIKRHIFAKHTADKDKKWFHCEKCPFKTIWKQTFVEHFCDKIIKCDQCSFRTSWEKSLKDHKVLKHTEDKDKKWFQCDRCTFRSVRKNNLKQHFNSRHAEDKRWFQCEKCDYRATQKAHVAKHCLAKHTDDEDKKWLQCDRCDYKTLQTSNLNSHFLTKHTNDKDKKWFECEKCKFKTIWKVSLMRHCCENRFNCEACDFKTRWEKSLERHQIRYHAWSGNGIRQT